jgi:hypothetical protein
VCVGDRHDVDAVAACDAGLRGVWRDRKGAGETRIPRITTLTVLRDVIAAM